MNTTLERDVMTECYEDVQKLVAYTARKFARRYGGHLDDLLSDANSAFVRGHIAIMEGRMNAECYATEIRRYVWYDLFDRFRTNNGLRNINKKPAKRLGDALAEVACPEEPQPLSELLEGLSEDAALAVELVLNTPAELAAVAEGKGGKPNNYRSTIRQHFKDLGWAAERINECFAEIKDALRS